MGVGEAETIDHAGGSGNASWWMRLVSSLKTSPQGDAFSLIRLVLIPIAVVAILTAIIRISGVDLKLERAIYFAGEQSWSLGDNSFWKFLYKFGSIPALMVVVGSVVGLIVSSYKLAWREWRRVFVFNILLFALGPGVIANGLLKEYWGRPRPREVKELGGRSQFDPVLTIDKSSEGKSFPSGHATVGFYFVGCFFLLRRHRRELASMAMQAAIALGAMIGIARMAQGGHFLSDVLWAFAVCYFSALVLYYGLSLHKGLCREGAKTRKMPIWQRVSLILIGMGAIAAVTLATPYRSTRDFYLLKETSKSNPIHLVLKFTEGAHVLIQGEQFRITGEAYGHGVPTSKISAALWEGMRGENALVVYGERISGWFSEVNEQLKLSVPWERIVSLEIEAGTANLSFNVAELASEMPLHLKNGEGELLFKLNGQKFFIDGRDSLEIEGRAKLEESLGVEGVVVLKIEDEFVGRILIED